MKNSADQGACYPQRPKAEVDIEDITRWREDMNFMFEWRDIVLRPREHKIHIFELACNVLFII